MEALSSRNYLILVECRRQIKPEYAAPAWSFRYSEDVVSISILARTSLGLGVLVCTACASLNSGSDNEPAPQSFYTVTAEIALARHEPRVAALQYAAAAAGQTDEQLFDRASQVAADGLQPSVAARIAQRWLEVDPKSVTAHRAAARAALALDRIDEAAAQYRVVLELSPIGPDAEFVALENEFAASDNVYGARQLADRLAVVFPNSAAALRVQGFAALRADDPEAAVRSLTAASQMPAVPPLDDTAQRELLQALARARIMSGDAEAPLAEARAATLREDTPANRLDYALLLMTAQRNEQALKQLQILARNPETAPVALRLSGVIEFQEGNLAAATERFAELLKTEKFLDDAFYYLGLIADRNNDPEHALRLYAQVQSGDNSVPALLRATNILETHGAAEAGDELLDRLVEDEPSRAPDILAARARMYADADAQPRAAAVLEQGIADYPDSVDLRYAQASLYEEQGRLNDSLHELTAIAKARPQDPTALNALGYTLADHSRELPRARRLIESARSAAPKNSAIMDSMGWVLYRQGDNARAESFLRSAYADDRGADIAAHLGEVLWQMGRKTDAEQIWSEAGAADSSNRLLKSTRERFNALPPPPAASKPAPTLE